MADSENHDRKDWLVEELWQLIQDSRWLVAEIQRLSAEYEVVRQKAADEKYTKRGEHN